MKQNELDKLMGKRWYKHISLKTEEVDLQPLFHNPYAVNSLLKWLEQCVVISFAKWEEDKARAIDWQFGELKRLYEDYQEIMASWEDSDEDEEADEE